MLEESLHKNQTHAQHGVFRHCTVKTLVIEHIKKTVVTFHKHTELHLLTIKSMSTKSWQTCIMSYITLVNYMGLLDMKTLSLYEYYVGIIINFVLLEA